MNTGTRTWALLVLGVLVGGCAADGGGTAGPGPGAGGGGAGGSGGGVGGSSTGGAPATCDPSSCSGSSQCCSDVCVETASCSFSVTDVTPFDGWVNGGDYLTLTGSGFSQGMKVFIGDGRAPVRVVSPTEAHVQTPPAPGGAYDVKVELGGQTTTLKNGFSYKSGFVTDTWGQSAIGTGRGNQPGLGVLKDGRLLVTGGSTQPTDAMGTALDSAEIWDRSTLTATPISSKMSTPRLYSAALPLLDGTVLVVGGACFDPDCNGNAALADTFDPATNTFTPTAGPTSTPIYRGIAVLLADGRALIAGGTGADIYDPETRTFAPAAGAPAKVTLAARLRDGRVYLRFADAHATQTASIYDPDTGTFTSAGAGAVRRPGTRGHTQPDDMLALIAGEDTQPQGGGIGTLASIELLDPVTATFSTAPYSLAQGRYYHATAIVRDGSIFVLGGFTIENPGPPACAPMTDSVERIDPVGGSVAPYQKMPKVNADMVAATLRDGTVVVVGGGVCNTPASLTDVLYLPGKDSIE